MSFDDAFRRARAGLQVRRAAWQLGARYNESIVFRSGGGTARAVGVSRSATGVETAALATTVTAEDMYASDWEAA